MKVNRLLGSNFVLGSQTTGTNMDLLHFAINHDSRRMDIGIETPVGMAFRMADIFTEHRCFTANFALQDRNSFDILTSML